MKAGEAIKLIMNRQKMSQIRLGEIIGVKQTAISMRINYKNISEEVITQMLKPLGYKMVFMPKEAETPEGAFEIN